MSGIMPGLGAPGLVEALEENQFAFLRGFGRAPGGELDEGPEAVRAVSGVPSPGLNVVFRTRFAPDEADARIAATLAPFRERGLPFSWLVSPSTAPADTGERLRAHGLRHGADVPWMTAELAALREGRPAPSGLTIVEVTDDDTLAQFDRAHARGFGAPEEIARAYTAIYAALDPGPDRPLRHYAGLLYGEPVASASLLLAAGVAGVYGVATAPEARRRGIGNAMTLTCLRTARDLGYRVGTLQASALGLHVYQRVGFVEQCTVSWYDWRP